MADAREHAQCLDSSVKIRGLKNCNISLDLIWYLDNTVNLLKLYLGDKFEASVVHVHVGLLLCDLRRKMGS